MNTQTNTPTTKPSLPHEKAVLKQDPWGFVVHKMPQGTFLTLQNRQVGALCLQELTLQVPEIKKTSSHLTTHVATQESFKHRRCSLVQAEISLQAKDVATLWSVTALEEVGITDFSIRANLGHLLCSGLLRVHGYQAPFTCKAALLPGGMHELLLVFFATRLYGWLPIAASQIPQYLYQATPYRTLFKLHDTGFWSLQPIAQLLGLALPQAGWKIPDLQTASHLQASISPQEIRISATAKPQVALSQIDTAAPATAYESWKATAEFADGQIALLQGKWQQAYKLLRQALESGHNHDWIYERLLQVGTLTSDLRAPTQLLCEQLLAAERLPALAYNTLAALALQQQQHEAAAQYYQNAALSVLPVAGSDVETAFAWYGAACAIRDIDKARALTYLNHGLALPNPDIALHAAAYKLQRQLGDIESATHIAEKWLQYSDASIHTIAWHLELGSLYLEQHHETKAKQHLEEVLQEDPNNRQALRLLANCAIAEQLPQQAVDALLRALTLAKKAGETEESIDIQQNLADILQHALDDKPAALFHCLQILEKAPWHPQAGRIRMQAAELACAIPEQHSVALQLLHEQLEQTPTHTQARDLLLQVLTQQNDPQALMVALQDAADHCIDLQQQADIWLRLYRLQHNIGLPKTVLLQTLQAILDIDVSREDTRIAAATAQVEIYQQAYQATNPSQSNTQDLIRAYKQLIAALPTGAQRAEVCVQLGELLACTQSDWNQALTYAEKACKENPTAATGWLLAGKLVANLEGIAQARLRLKRGLPHCTDTAAAALCLRLAQLAKTAGDIAEQAEYLRAAAATCHHMLPTTEAQALIEALTTLGHTKEAATWYERWAQPGGPMEPKTAWLQAAKLYASQGCLDEAQKLWDKLLAQDDPHTSLEAALAALQHLPNHATANLHIAWLKYQQKQWAPALQHFLTALCGPESGHVACDSLKAAYSQAAALATDFNPPAILKLQAAFARDFGNSPWPNVTSLSDSLALQQQHNDLLELYTWQLSLPQLDHHQQTALHSKMAQLLHHVMHKPHMAIVHYQALCQLQPQAVAKRQTLLELLNQPEDLAAVARLHAELAQLLEDQPQALQHILQACEIFVDTLENPQAASLALKAFVARALSLDSTQLHGWLKRLSLTKELAHALLHTLRQAMDAQDNRWHELFALWCGPLQDAPCAWQWAQKLTQENPHQDAPWLMHVELAQSQPTLGNVAQVLQNWAEHRTGVQRANILLKLANILQSRGATQQERLVLQQAALANPSDVDILQRLALSCEQHMLWAQAVQYFEQAIDQTTNASLRDTYLNHLVRIATNLPESGNIIAQALARLTQPTTAQSQQYATFLLEQKAYEELQQKNLAVHLSSQILLEIGEQLLVEDKWQQGQAFLTAAMRDDQTANLAWSIGLAKLRLKGRLRELALWRLQVAEQNASPTWLAIMGRAELFEADKLPHDQAPAALNQDIAQLDLSIMPAAWALYEVGRSVQNQSWTYAATQALIAHLPPTEPRLLEILQTHLPLELHMGDAHAALSVAKRVEEMQPGAAGDLLEQALIKTGDNKALCTLLSQQAALDSRAAPTIWLHVARLKLQTHLPEDAAVILPRVPTNHRQRLWGELTYLTGKALADIDLQLLGAQTCVEHCQELVEKAAWVRQAAQLVWWKKGDAATAQAYLQQVQAAQIYTYDDILAELLHLPATLAVQTLHEALCLLPSTYHHTLWCKIATLEHEQQHTTAAANALQQAFASLAEQDPTAVENLATLSKAYGAKDIWLACLRRLFAWQSATDKTASQTVATALGLVDALAANEAWQELLVVCEHMATTLAAPDSTSWALKGAFYAQQHLHDLPKAQRCWQQVVQEDPTYEHVQTAWQLATQLNDEPNIIALSNHMLTFVEPQDPQYASLLRQIYQAQTNLAEKTAATQTLQRLVDNQHATTFEIQTLAAAMVADNPQAAADLYSIAAQQSDTSQARVAWLTAIRAYQRANNLQKAHYALEQLLATGADDLQTWMMVWQVSHDAAHRMQAAHKLLAHKEDIAWGAQQRAELRLWAARYAVQDRQTKLALSRVKQAGYFYLSTAWADLYEQILHNAKKPLALAKLYLTAAQENLWLQDTLYGKLNTAVQTFAELKHADLHLQALQALNCCRPSIEISQQILEVLAHSNQRAAFDRYLEAMQTNQQHLLADTTISVQIARLYHQSFNDAQAAYAWLLPYFHKLGNTELSVELLDDLQVYAKAAGASSELFELLQNKAQEPHRPTAWKLIQHAAKMAIDMQQPELGFALTMQLLAAKVAQDEELAFAADYARQTNQHAELLQILMQQAAIANNPVITAQYLTEAAMYTDLQNDVLVQAYEACEQANEATLQARLIDRATEILPVLQARIPDMPTQQQLRYLPLLGQALENAGEDLQAIGTYETLLENLQPNAPAWLEQHLIHLYTQQSMWENLAKLYRQQAKHAQNIAERLGANYHLGCILRDHLHNPVQAAACFAECISASPQNTAIRQLATGALGLLHAQDKNHAAVIELLAANTHADAPVEQIWALAQAYAQTQQTTEALPWTTKVLAINPEHLAANRQYAELLETTEQYLEAQAQWQVYLSQAASQTPTQQDPNLYVHVANLAQRNQDIVHEQSLLEQAVALCEPNQRLSQRLLKLYESTEQWQKAVDLRQQELSLANTEDARLQHCLILAEQYQTKLGQTEQVIDMLEKASLLAPCDGAILQSLMALYDPQKHNLKFLLAAERWLNLQDHKFDDVQFLCSLAKAYKPIDLVRTTELYAKVLELQPHNEKLRCTVEDLYWQLGDINAYVAMQEAWLPTVQDKLTKAKGYANLATVYVENLQAPKQAIAALKKAITQSPDETKYLKRLGQLYALNSRSYPQAQAVYERCLQADPYNTELLRIVARLAGQQQRTWQAYNDYACLAYLLPNDAEALTFVQTCREQRPILNEQVGREHERADVLGNSETLDVANDIFVSLARFAEQAYLETQSTQSNPHLKPLQHESKVAQFVQRLGQHMDIPTTTLYAWETGGWRCQLEPKLNPELWIGDTLRKPIRHASCAFMVARAIEMYRNGHTLCSMLTTQELQNMLDAMCQVIVPTKEGKDLPIQARNFYDCMQPLVTKDIIKMLKTSVQQYQAFSYNLQDLETWQQSCIMLANRQALLLTCDIEQALSTLQHAQNITAQTPQQRLAVLQNNQQCRDLYVFAQSKQYLKLTEKIGMAVFLKKAA